MVAIFFFASVFTVNWSSAQYSFGTSPVEQPTLNDTTTVRPTINAEPLATPTFGLKADEVTLPTENLKKSPQKVTVFGYYRLFVYGRNITEPYPGLEPFDRGFSVGDGYREPMLSLNVLARPNGRSSFGTELFFFTPYRGGNLTEDNVFQVNLGINFYGNFRTDVGTFGIRAGGIHWYNLSPFTIGVYQVLDRFSIFDRTPWEGVPNTAKYDSYYNTGLINVGDQRWNYEPFQGIILNGVKLPADFYFDVFWGKMQPNGGLINAQDDPYATIQNPGNAGNVPSYQGFAGTRRVLPSYITGGRIGKRFGNQLRNSVAYNLVHDYTSLDSIGSANRNYQVHTLSFNLNVKSVLIGGELGGSRLASPITEPLWGEALMVRVRVPKVYTFIPLDLQIYQISKNFFNANGEITTNANPEINKNFLVQEPAGIGSVGGLLTQIGQLQHNRRGINFNTSYQAGPVKFNLGWGLAQEIDAITTELSYIHRINGLAMSRIYQPFPANAVNATVYGPYERNYSFFRGAFEKVKTTDVDGNGETSTQKYYNSVNVQGKYKTMVNRRPLYLFYLGEFGSIQTKASAIPTLNEDAYIFAQYHEVDLYYEILPKFILAGYFGIERIQGGRFTDWGETNLPRDQTGIGIGGGFDWTFVKNTGLYVRYRHMDFNDKNFELDQYKGREITVELKSFF